MSKTNENTCIGKVFYSDLNTAGVLLPPLSFFREDRLLESAVIPYSPSYYDILKVDRLSKEKGEKILLQVRKIAYMSKEQFDMEHKFRGSQEFYPEDYRFAVKIVYCSIIDNKLNSPISPNDQACLLLKKDQDMYFPIEDNQVLKEDQVDKQQQISLGNMQILGQHENLEKKYKGKIEYNNFLKEINIQLNPTKIFDSNLLLLGSRGMNKGELVKIIVSQLISCKTCDYSVLILDPTGYYADLLEKTEISANKLNIRSLKELRLDLSNGFGPEYMDDQEILNQLSSSLSSQEYKELSEKLRFKKIAWNQLQTLKDGISSGLIEKLKRRFATTTTITRPKQITVCDFTREFTKNKEQDNDVYFIMQEIFFEAIRRTKQKRIENDINRKVENEKDPAKKRNISKNKEPVKDLNLIIIIDNLDKYCPAPIMNYEETVHSNTREIIMDAISRSCTFKIGFVGLSSAPSRMHKDLLYMMRTKILGNENAYLEEKVYMEALGIESGLSSRLDPDEFIILGELAPKPTPLLFKIVSDNGNKNDKESTKK